MNANQCDTQSVRKMMIRTELVINREVLILLVCCRAHECGDCVIDVLPVKSNYDIFGTAISC